MSGNGDEGTQARVLVVNLGGLDPIGGSVVNDGSTKPSSSAFSLLFKANDDVRDEAIHIRSLIVSNQRAKQMKTTISPNWIHAE